MKSIEYMRKSPSVRSISYPIGPDYSCLHAFPRHLEVLECRDVDIITEPLLEMVAQTFPELRKLRIDCGEDGPYEPLASEGKTGRDLGVRCAFILITSSVTNSYDRGNMLIS